MIVWAKIDLYTSTGSLGDNMVIPGIDFIILISSILQCVKPSVFKTTPLEDQPL